MRAAKAQHVFLTAGFLVMIYSIGLTQIGIELVGRQRPLVFDLFLQKPSRENLRAYETEMEQACWFARKLRPWAQYLQFLLLHDMGEKSLLGRDGWLFYRPGVQYLVEPWPVRSSSNETHDDPFEAIVSFRDQLAARGIRLLVMPMPGKASVYPEMLTRRAVGAKRPVGGHTLELIARLKRAGVEVIDLSETFAEARDRQPSGDDTQYYLSQDTHWSPKGVSLAAETVARRILDLGWVDKGAVRYDEKPVTLSRYGDVLRMIEVPQIEWHFAPEEVECVQVVRRDTGEPYRDDPASEVLVLGDSYLRIYEQDEPGSAGFIAHLARQLRFPLASIVNDGGASTLVRQKLSRTPALLVGKKVVIWEFVERDIRFGTEGWQEVPLPDPLPMEPGNRKK